MKRITINRYILAVFAAMIFMGLSPSLISAQVKGPDVTKVEVGRDAVEGTLVQTGPKIWTYSQTNGSAAGTLTETGRDEWSVYLNSPQFTSVIINLFQKTFVLKQGSNVVYEGKILSSSNAAIGSSNSTTPPVANLEQDCFNAIQGKVAYDQLGNKTWGASNVQILCKGTTNPAATIACFQAEIQSHNSWSRGIEACKVGATTPRATAETATTDTTDSTDTTLSTANRAATNSPTESPLTGNEMSRVMQWISVRTSAARMPFCWRRSFGRGFGNIPLCPSGYAKDPGSLICTTPCKADEQYFDNICYPRDCPAGYRNDGLYCGKPGAKTRESFPWKPGDPFLPNYSGPMGRCETKYGNGNCERGGALIFPKCGIGFKPVAEGSVCTPICPSEYTDIGVSCKKPTSKRGVVYANTCPAGTVKDPTGDLCYPACNSGQVAGNQTVVINAGPPENFKGVGPVCWQNCPSHQSKDCGAGCATTDGECAKAVFSMVSSPIIAAVKIAALVATFGGSAAATGSAGAAVGGGKLIANSPKLLKLAQLADKLQRFAKTYETSIKALTATATVIATLKSQTELFATEFANNFGDMTSPEIEKEIDDRFSKSAAYEVKKEWGRHHVGLMMEANSINTAKNFLSIAGIADPTGLTGVVSAFTNPLCQFNSPFPTVNPKY